MEPLETSTHVEFANLSNWIKQYLNKYLVDINTNRTFLCESINCVIKIETDITILSLVLRDLYTADIRTIRPYEVKDFNIYNGLITKEEKKFYNINGVTYFWLDNIFYKKIFGRFEKVDFKRDGFHQSGSVHFLHN